MSGSNITSFFKLVWLHIVRISRCFFKNIGFKLSMVFVIFSFAVSLFLLIPSAFSHVPVFSYFISTMELPLSYEFEGRIFLIDSEGDSVKQNIKVFIGGYKIETISGENFLLNFSSPSSEYFYLTIEYKNSSGAELTVAKKIEINQKTNFKEEIEIYV